MQKDFHFSVVYVLCRFAGLTPQDGQVVATASQYTDNCKMVGRLYRSDGRYHIAVPTQAPPQLALSEKWQKRILRPFHFVHAGANPRVTTAGNDRVRSLVEEAIELVGSDRRLGLKALGISLHAFADSYAHQGFSAFKGPENNVQDLRLDPNDPKLLKKITGGFLYRFPNLAPQIGHAEAVHCPDIPFLRWRYKRPAGAWWNGDPPDGVTANGKWIIRDNTEIAAAAVRSISALLQGVPGTAAGLSLDHQQGLLSADLFRSFDSLERRQKQWEALVMASNGFGNITPAEKGGYRYAGKDWFGDAFGFALTGSGGAAHLGLKPGYETSHWWDFQKAARWVMRTLSPW